MHEPQRPLQACTSVEERGDVRDAELYVVEHAAALLLHLTFSVGHFLSSCSHVLGDDQCGRQDSVGDTKIHAVTDCYRLDLWRDIHPKQECCFAYCFTSEQGLSFHFLYL